uniref:Uncharacterized protein n=1 Tax=Aegilops tauschii subsp. strangulata TaxID=200361 RepID=A0A453MYR0_AEGTS
GSITCWLPAPWKASLPGLATDDAPRPLYNHNQRGSCGVSVRGGRRGEAGATIYQARSAESHDEEAHHPSAVAAAIPPPRRRRGPGGRRRRACAAPSPGTYATPPAVG